MRGWAYQAVAALAQRLPEHFEVQWGKPCSGLKSCPNPREALGALWPTHTRI
jgi:hypothetical protein